MAKFNALIFIAGAAVGAVATWFGAKKYFERISQEEIDSVKEKYTWKKTDMEEPKKDEKEKETQQEDNRHKADVTKAKPDLVEYIEKIKEAGYINYSNLTKKEASEDKTMDKPYVISPDEFGENDDYMTINLVYYAKDGVLADDNDDPLEDIPGCVGKDFKNHFGEYENDTVYIRNNKFRCDYEILKDNRSYLEVTGIDLDEES